MLKVFLIAVMGASSLADKLLQHDDISKELLKKIAVKSHTQLKTSIKTSKLKPEKNREYLLSLTPRNLCEEFRNNSPLSFSLLVKGLFGLTDENEMFESQKLMNNVCLILSIVAKCINKKAIGYALLLTTEARDGGLREDSIKLLLSCLVHPRTSQKFDKMLLQKAGIVS